MVRRGDSSYVKFVVMAPMLLEFHYQDANNFIGVETGLRILESQQHGIVILNQVSLCSPWILL